MKQCASHVYAPIAQSYLQGFCQSKETVKVEKAPVKTCADDPSLCSTDQLCGQRLTFNSGKAAWRTDNVMHVAEAKRRGLSCGVVRALTANEKAISLTKTCIEDATACTCVELCSRGTHYISGGSSKTWISGGSEYVFRNEDQRRGLSCEVELENCLHNVDYASVCTNNSLCTKATIGHVSKKSWSHIINDKKFVSEANRRGLNCGVTQAVAKPAIKTAEIFSKTHFVKLGGTERKQLQYGLKQLGYYSSSIDGLWGKGTKAGVNSFAKDRNLSSNFSNSVFDALASEVAFENMPVSEPVSEKTIVNKNKLVCKMNDAETFDRIEKKLGVKFFTVNFLAQICVR